jgi:glycyl-tRNA synthetase beta subunit
MGIEGSRMAWAQRLNAVRSTRADRESRDSAEAMRRAANLNAKKKGRQKERGRHKAGPSP